jgi:hypothetical protein
MAPCAGPLLADLATLHQLIEQKPRVGRDGAVAFAGAGNDGPSAVARSRVRTVITDVPGAVGSVISGNQATRRS